MRIMMFKTAFFSLLVLPLMQSCTPAADTKATDAIKDFYGAYIRENSKEPGDMKAVESIKKKHCTSSLLQKLSGEELDADPFLDAQDVDANWVNTMEVLPEGSAENVYGVCFLLTPGESKHCVRVAMKQEGGEWKIDDVHP